MYLLLKFTSAPWLAEQIKLHTGDNEAARLIAHSILGAVVAELQGNSGLADGAGAVVGEIAADIIRKQLYGKEVKDLTEAEKETIIALSQLVAGLATAVGYEIIQENSDNNSSNNELNNSEATAVGDAPILPSDDDNNKKNENNQKQRQQERFDELKDVFDKDNPKTNLTIDGQTIQQGSGSNRYTIRIYESQNLTDRQIYNYAEELVGQPLTKTREGVYTTRLQDGTSITLRNVSHSAEKTGARWTIEIRNSRNLARLYSGLKNKVEIKFR